MYEVKHDDRKAIECDWGSDPAALFDPNEWFTCFNWMEHTGQSVYTPFGDAVPFTDISHPDGTRTMQFDDDGTILEIPNVLSVNHRKGKSEFRNIGATYWVDHSTREIVQVP